MKDIVCANLTSHLQVVWRACKWSLACCRVARRGVHSTPLQTRIPKVPSPPGHSPVSGHSMCWYSRTEMLRNKTYRKSLHNPRGHTNERAYAKRRQKEEDGKTFVCDKRDRASYYFRVLSWFFLNNTVFWSFTKKDLFKARWRLVENVFKQNYCHACHTRFAIMLRKFIIRPSLDPKLSLFGKLVISFAPAECAGIPDKCPKIHSLTKVGPYILPQSLSGMHSTT